MSHQPAKHRSLFYGALVAAVVLAIYLVWIPATIIARGDPSGSLFETFIAAAVNVSGIGLLTILVVEVFRWLRGRV